MDEVVTMMNAGEENLHVVKGGDFGESGSGDGVMVMNAGEDNMHVVNGGNIGESMNAGEENMHVVSSGNFGESGSEDGVMVMNAREENLHVVNGGSFGESIVNAGEENMHVVNGGIFGEFVSEDELIEVNAGEKNLHVVNGRSYGESVSGSVEKVDVSTVKGGNGGDRKGKSVLEEIGEAGDAIFTGEPPILCSGECSVNAGKVSRMTAADFQLLNQENSEADKKLSRLERIELGRMFQIAVSCHDWEKAESLILLADPQTLNDALCISLDSVWFLCTEQELIGITSLIKKIIHYGAYDFTRAALRTSFLASCVSACQSPTLSLTDQVTVMAQRLHDRLQECNGDEILKAEAGAKVQKFTEWALKCIGFHSRSQGHKDRVSDSSVFEIELRLTAFKIFLDFAGSKLNGKDFTEAFDAACFPLTLFSTSFDSGWASGVSATAVQGLLSMLVEGGADNVNQCFLEASRFGSTELVRILLQIAQRNSLDIDVDQALGYASYYCKINTMECLVGEGNAVTFSGPLVRAAERGCLQVVQWFVKRGCRGMDLCLALAAAASSSQVEVAAFLLPHVSHQDLTGHSIEILKAAGEGCAGSFDGVAFLLESDFLQDPSATYAVADTIAKCDDVAVNPELKAYLREHWSEEAFLNGLRYEQDHYLNVMRILRWGECAICLNDLPGPLITAVSYLPLYRECVKKDGLLLSQRLRGQLVEAVNRLGCGPVDERNHGRELLLVLEHRLPLFLLKTGNALT